jgi:hypothetical protein
MDGYSPSISAFTDWLDKLETSGRHTVSSYSKVPKARRPLYWPDNSSPRDFYAALISLETEKYADLYRISDHEKVFQPYMGHRRVFQTISGYLGVGPKWMEPNDQVVVFDGGRTPFILRNVPTTHEEMSEKWQLVGDCFLLGWMRGDYFGHTVVDEMPQYPIRRASEYLVREWFVLI